MADLTGQFELSCQSLSAVCRHISRRKDQDREISVAGVSILVKPSSPDESRPFLLSFLFGLAAFILCNRLDDVLLSSATNTLLPIADYPLPIVEYLHTAAT